MNDIAVLKSDKDAEAIFKVIKKLHCYGCVGVEQLREFVKAWLRSSELFLIKTNGQFLVEEGDSNLLKMCCRCVVPAFVYVRFNCSGRLMHYHAKVKAEYPTVKHSGGEIDKPMWLYR